MGWEGGGPFGSVCRTPLPQSRVKGTVPLLWVPPVPHEAVKEEIDTNHSHGCILVQITVMVYSENRVARRGDQVSVSLGTGRCVGGVGRG